MKHATWQFFLILAKQFHHLILRLSAVNHQWEASLYTPLHLTFKCLQLLLFVFPRPVIIESYLADSYPFRAFLRHAFLQNGVHSVEYGFVIVLDVFGMKSQHREYISRITTTYLPHRSDGIPVDAWHEEIFCACLLSSGNHLVEVFLKFFSVNMCMSVNILHSFR